MVLSVLRPFMNAKKIASSFHGTSQVIFPICTAEKNRLLLIAYIFFCARLNLIGHRVNEKTRRVQISILNKQKKPLQINIIMLKLTQKIPFQSIRHIIKKNKKCSTNQKITAQLMFQPQPTVLTYEVAR